jgi:hypothetical protein
LCIARAMNSDASKPTDSTPPPERERNTILERLVKRGIESGIGAISRSEDTVRSVIEGLKLPKEATHVVLDQIDETKKGLYQAVAKEMRDFLQSTNFATDVKKILTGLAFEVKMEVRFKPAENDEGLRPDVAAHANLKSTRKPKRQASPPLEPRDPPTDE